MATLAELVPRPWKSSCFLGVACTRICDCGDTCFAFEVDTKACVTAGQEHWVPEVQGSVRCSAWGIHQVGGQGGVMSISDSSVSPLLQWLQNSIASAGLAVGNQSSCGSCGSSSGTDSTQTFQQTLQMLSNQAAQPTELQQPSGANGTHGHHHHHQHSGGGNDDHGNGSFISQLAQSIINDLQQPDGTEISSSVGSSITPNTGRSSFIDGLAGAIANDLLSKYQQGTGSGPIPSSSSASNQVSAIA